MRIRFGMAAQSAGSICVSASRSSQSVSARIAVGAINSGAGREDAEDGSEALQLENVAIPGVARDSSGPKEKSDRSPRAAQP